MVDHRKFIRHPSDIPIEFTAADGSPTALGHAQDVSFGGLAESSAGIAKVLFVVFMAGFVITLSLGLVAARRLTL